MYLESKKMTCDLRYFRFVICETNEQTVYYQDM